MTRAEIAAGLAAWELLIQNSRQITRYIENAEKERAASRSASESPALRKKA